MYGQFYSNNIFIIDDYYLNRQNAGRDGFALQERSFLCFNIFNIFTFILIL